VDVPLTIADALGQELDIVIGAEMAEVEEGEPNEPRGIHIRAGAELMTLLVALGQAVARRVMPLTA
jgi:hypothetical protein